MVIDRLEPTRRPARRPSGFQEWRHLLFLHWAVPIESLRQFVPAPLELDLYDGVAYVGVVPFAMRYVRPRWCPRFLGFSFLETNVRTYVSYEGRPGVYFFSLDAASKIAVWIARRYWGLPYFHAQMDCQQSGDEFRYCSVRSGSAAHHRVCWRVGEEMGPSQLESVEFFFLERYLLFVRQGKTICVGQVHHVPYPTRKAEIIELEDHLVSAAGIASCSDEPSFVHYSPGVDVEIFPLESVSFQSDAPSRGFRQQQ
jgi:uncharacterized protein YqjF (DUF2071 family)